MANVFGFPGTYLVSAVSVLHPRNSAYLATPGLDAPFFLLRHSSITCLGLLMRLVFRQQFSHSGWPGGALKAWRQMIGATPEL